MAGISNVSSIAGTAAAFPSCNADSLPFPDLFGAEVINIQASPIVNYSATTHRLLVPWTQNEFSDLSFCNISVEYTHPGRDDTVTVTMLLPEDSAWNGRFLAAGGGGWAASLGDEYQVPALNEGFSVASTDGGVPLGGRTSEGWTLLSPGNPDIERLNTFASQSLHDLAVIGKGITESYYGQPAQYSYFSGCSQGGRQANIMAQWYPHDYDGIAALAPALNILRFFPGLGWSHQIMYELDYFPPPCEILAFTAAAIEACDELDGLKDDVISSPQMCHFDPFSLVGQTFDCDGGEATFTEEGATIVNATWEGPTTAQINEQFNWFGYSYDTDIQGAVSNTTCNEDGTCTAPASPFSDDWLRLWVAADPDLDMSQLSRQEYVRLSLEGVQRYYSIYGTSDPDIRDFGKSGGKMITVHGIADTSVPYLGSPYYRDQVYDVDPYVDDYFRLFMAPGMAHCVPGPGPYPVDILTSLMAWVEQGKAPQQLVARNASNLEPATGMLPEGTSENVGRPLCLYPEIQEYVGGDPNLQSSFRCAHTHKKADP